MIPGIESNYQRIKTLTAKLSKYYERLRPFRETLSGLGSGKMILDEDELDAFELKAVRLALLAAWLEMRRRERIAQLSKNEKKKIWKEELQRV